MTTLLHSPTGRLRAGSMLALNRLMIGSLALTGDPVAQVLRGSRRTDVYGAYERIRGRGEVSLSRFGIRTVTSRALCEQVLKDPRFGVQPPEGTVARADMVTVEANGPLAGSFLELDPPDHTRLRRIAAPAFRPKLIREHAPMIEAILHDLVDRAVQRGRVDLVTDIASPFPIAVISRLLGIPPEDTAQFGRIGSLVGQSLDGVRTIAQARRLRDASVELRALFRRLADERRVDPHDDVISQLAAAESDGRLVAADLTATCGLLLVAGFETTVNLIGNGIAALLGSPEADRSRWAGLADDPELPLRVVEETLRWDPPVQLTSRIALRDLELGGRSLPAGTFALVLLAAANRDPESYSEPATFDPARRDEPEHLAFSSGIHYCLGAPLARLEAELAFRVLATRAPELRLLPGARRRSGVTIRGYASLPAVLG